MAALLGILCGIVACLPLAMALRRATSGIGPGVAAVVVSFLLVHGALLAVRVLWPQQVVPFGALASLTFLLGSVVVTLRNRPW